MIFKSLGDKELFTLCLFGEARGESIDGKIAVASVIINRLKRQSWFGKSLKEVILKPYQFSCFLEKDPNRKVLEKIADEFREHLTENIALRECYWVAEGVLDEWLTSNVGKATHYHTKQVDPKWDNEMKLITIIGNHEFYEEA
ncbi:MAG TPA: cell wall hydrolase [Nitrospirae bacterium]|nr:cell wall hydrolase [Nitrospirota bacterium]HDH51230.1 cell wall hydrolase [Nitrospirota bacterium]HDK81012.1 cell wall hydrolase [Nitrospirota bacterium]